MRKAPLFALLVLAGCASSSTSEPADAPARLIPAGETLDIRLAGVDGAMLHTVDVSPEQAWEALPSVFEALEIPVTHFDSRSRVIGNREFAVRRSLAGEPLQRFLDCGSSMTGPLTNAYDVRLSLLVEVLPRGGGVTQIRSSVEAVALSRRGVSGVPVSCGSTGRLERRVAELLTDLAAS
jgi:hypothetical protein